MTSTRRGLSLNIGLNKVDSTKYHDPQGNPWDGALGTCEADAIDLAALAKGQGFETTTLLTAEATADNIIEKIREAAKTLEEGDMFFLTFSGHGGYVDDKNGDEKDRKDETWVAYDRQIADDELYNELTGFAANVRVLMASDSCHSGTVAEEVPSPDAKAMPPHVAAGDQLERAKLYEQIQRTVPDAKESIQRLKAEVLLLSACADDELAYIGPRHSIFTGIFLRAWNKGRFEGTYRDFFKAIAELMPSRQTPQWYPPADKDPEFVVQRPFTI